MLPLLVVLAAAPAAPATLTLEEALRLAREHQPALRQSRAQVDAATARARQSFAAMLPGASMSLGYSRSTANFVARPGAVPSSLAGTSSITLDSYDYWNGSLAVSATLWDTGQNWHRWKSALSTVQVQEAQEKAELRATEATVRTRFYAAASQRELVQVARQAVDAVAARLAQVQGMVSVGTRPDIDLAQVRADHANARLALLQAESAATAARAQLNQAMGVEFPPSYEVQAGEAEPLPEEAGESASLLDAALAARPEAAALEGQVEAQLLSLRAVRGSYLPTLGLQLGGTLASRSLPTVVPNLNAQLTMNWSLFEGGATRAQESEVEATLRQLEAARDVLRQQVRLELEQALLEVATARASVEVAGEAHAAAAEQLRLAEGRYRAGTGSALELSDAQLGATRASVQVVQARFTLASARAALLAALGR